MRIKKPESEKNNVKGSFTGKNQDPETGRFISPQGARYIKDQKKKKKI